MRTIAVWSLIVVLLISTTPATFAKSYSDWPILRTLVDQGIAIRTKDGETLFGVLSFVDDSEIKILLADDRQLDAQETSFKRENVAKVWRATLRFDERNTGKGALIGAGVGLGAGFATVLVMAKRGSSDPPHGFALFPLIGAGVGALFGASKKKDHKKQKLIYSI